MKTVVAVRPYAGPVDPDGTVAVYDLTVPGPHAYAANGVIVGNSKRVSMLDVNALLAHGAYETIRDATLYRGQKNDDYWLAYLQGHTPRAPSVPLAFQKFVGQLKAAGVNVVPDGAKLHVLGLTDRDVDGLAEGRELTSGQALRDKAGELSPAPGGLFDRLLTGGLEGKLWSAYRLHEPMPSPVFEEPIRRLLGLTQNQYESVLSGAHELGGYGSGPQAVRQALGAINVKRELDKARAKFRDGKGDARDQAARKIGYLKTLDRLNMHPKDWVLSKVPVLPPAFRPVSKLPDGTPLIASPNYLYLELFEADKNLKDLKGRLGEAGVGAERLAVYNAFKALTGLADPLQKELQNKGVKGILADVFGSSPKFGCYDDATEILTRDGWLPFPKLRPGIEVATLNPDTGAFEWQMPDEVQHYPYVGELVELKFGKKYGRDELGSRVDLLLTPNHRNWVRIRQDKIADDRVEDGWAFEPAYMTAASGNRRQFRTAASDWAGHEDLPDFVPAGAGEAFAELVGWWVAEGWIHSDEKAAELCQATGRNAVKCDQIQAVIDAVGLRHSVYDYDGRGVVKCRYRHWSIKSQELADWLRIHAGRLAAGKRLTSNIKDWSRPLLAAFLKGYMLGDGCYRRAVKRTPGKKTHKHRSPITDTFAKVNTTSYRLFEDLTEVCCKLGLTLHRGVDREAEGNYSHMYIGNISGQRFTQSDGHTGKAVVRYNGMVHCCTVPNGIVFVRRNGVPVFSGNSVQRKLISSNVDNVGRGVLIPDPELDMDAAGIPEKMAFTIYGKHVARRLARSGMPLREALRSVKDHADPARKALLAEMEARPVLINRAPVLHKFGFMAFRPRLTTDDVIKLSPLVFKGFNADSDGDQMNAHVPATDEAVREAYDRLLPSRNLFSPADIESPIHVFGQDFLSGLHAATAGKPDDGKRPRKTFATKKDVVAALARHEIALDEAVQILED